MAEQIDAIEGAMSWLISSQNRDGQRAGTWSQEKDITRLFLTTNQVLCTLLTIGYPRENSAINQGLEWLKSQLYNNDIVFYKRVNALESLLLAGDRETADQLFSQAVKYAEAEPIENLLTSENVLAVFLLYIIGKYYVDVSQNLVTKLWDAVDKVLDDEGTVARNIALTAFVLLVTKQSTTAPTTVTKKCVRSREWLQHTWVDINGRGWGRGIVVNAYVLRSIVLSGMNSQQSWQHKVHETRDWLFKQLNSDHCPEDRIAAYGSIKNSEYTTAVVLRTLALVLSGVPTIDGKVAVALFSRVQANLLEVRNDLAACLMSRRYVPLFIGFFFGFIIGLLAYNLWTGQSSPWEIRSNIFATLVSLLLLIIFEVIPRFWKGRRG